MELIKTYIFKRLCNKPVAWVVENDEDMLFGYRNFEYTYGFLTTKIYLTDYLIHIEDIESEPLVPLLRSVSQKIIDYKLGARQIV